MLIKNAAPMSFHLGTDDKSIKVPTPERLPLPQHLPLVMSFAKKGTTERFICNGGSFVQQYDLDTLNPELPYFNHATRMAELLLGAPNTIMFKRLMPKDAGPKSNVTIYLDIVEDNIPNYKRNSDGGIVVDGITGEGVVDTNKPTVRGHKIKYFTDYTTTSDDDLGLKMSKSGHMKGTDSEGNEIDSVMYPIMELKAAEQGAYYNNVGIRFGAYANADIASDILTDAKVVPYKLALMSRADIKSSPLVNKSLYGEENVMVSLKENVKNPVTTAQFDLKFKFDREWHNTTNPLLSLIYSNYTGVHMYNANIESILTRLIELERNEISEIAQEWNDGVNATTMSWFDFTTADSTDILEEKHLINILTGKSTLNVNYMTILMDKTTVATTGNIKEVDILNNTIFLNGGSDGTMTNEVFEELVLEELDKYNDPESRYQDLAVNPESIFYDSGFTVNTKLHLFKFISVRKDTAVVVGTRDYSLGDIVIPLSDERAIAVALKAKLKLALESTFFGTSVVRGMIVGGSALDMDDRFSDRASLVFEMANKLAKFGGAGNGKWNKAYLMDKAPGNIITTMKDIQPDFIPNGVKPVLWSSGLVWAQPFDLTQFHFPAMQSVYDDDTSVLNSFIMAMALCTLTKVAAEAWRNFTGDITLSNAAFKEAVEAFVVGRLDGIFAGLFKTVPEVIFTDNDKDRGYSWELVTKIGGNNMKTVQVHRIEAYRLADMA
jgi:hypothetical protein